MTLPSMRNTHTKQKQLHLKSTNIILCVVTILFTTKKWNSIQPETPVALYPNNCACYQIFYYSDDDDFGLSLTPSKVNHSSDSGDSPVLLGIYFVCGSIYFRHQRNAKCNATLEWCLPNFL